MLSIKNFFKIFICAFVFSTLSGYSLAGGHTSPNNLDNWDFDHDDNADALTDGLLLLRYAFGLTGDALVSNAIAEASPLTPLQVQENVAASTASFADIDNSGNVDALTDGLLLLRYLFGLTGDALLSSAVAENATRANANDIESYILSLMPSQTDLNDEQVTGGNSNSVDAIDESVNIVLNDEGEISGTADFYNSDFIKMNTFGAGQLIIEIVPDDNQSDIDCGLTQDIGPSSFSSNNFISDDTNTSINNDLFDSNCNLTAQFTDDRDFYLFVDIADESVGSVSYTVNYSFLQLVPTEIGQVCRIDEPYYPLPATSEYRKPLPGDRLEFNYKRNAASNSESEERETNLSVTYYSVENINTITLGPTPPTPYEPSANWGQVWDDDVFVSAITRTDDSLENRSAIYMYPNDGTVRLIKNSLNRVYLDTNANEGVFFWGQKYHPVLSEFSAFSDISISYEILNPTQRWVIETNTSINDSRVIMTGIGCIEAMMVQKNEERNWNYDSYWSNDISDGGLIKLEVDSIDAIHPYLGSVLSIVATEYFFTSGIANGEVFSAEITTLSDINFIEVLPPRVIK